MFNDNEKRFIDIIENAKKYCKGELELNLENGVWITKDYRAKLEGAFDIDKKGFNKRIISVSEAENQRINVIKCCDECDVSYVE